LDKIWRVFESRVFLGLLSLILSVVFWYYTVWVEGPQAIERILEIPVKVKNPPEKVLIEQDVNTVEVSLKGSKNLVGEITPKDVEAFLELSGLKPGVYRLQVQTLVPSGVQVVRVKPPFIVVSIRELADKEIPVRVLTIGSPAEGFLLNEVKVIPKSVVVRGPKDLLDKISYAFVTLDVSGVSSDFETFSEVRIEGGTEPRSSSDISILPSRVKLAVSLKPGWPTKIVRIKVNVMGKPAEAFDIASVEAIPSHITLMGPSSVLENIDEILTPPIDVSNLDRTNVFEVNISPPDERTKFLEKSSVRVIVELREKVLEREYLVPVKVTGSSVFLKWKISPPHVKVRVKGPFRRVSSLSAQDILVSLNLSGLENKEAMLPVEVSAPPGVEIVSVSPEVVKVSVVKEGG